MAEKPTCRYDTLERIRCTFIENTLPEGIAPIIQKARAYDGLMIRYSQFCLGEKSLDEIRFSTPGCPLHPLALRQPSYPTPERFISHQASACFGAKPIECSDRRIMFIGLLNLFGLVPFMRAVVSPMAASDSLGIGNAPLVAFHHDKVVNGI